jgi:hypothetical protein
VRTNFRFGNRSKTPDNVRCQRARLAKKLVSITKIAFVTGWPP